MLRDDRARLRLGLERVDRLRAVGAAADAAGLAAARAVLAVVAGGRGGGAGGRPVDLLGDGDPLALAGRAALGGAAVGQLQQALVVCKGNKHIAVEIFGFILVIVSFSVSVILNSVMINGSYFNLREISELSENGNASPTSPSSFSSM